MISNARLLQPGYDGGVVLVEAFDVVGRHDSILPTKADIFTLGGEEVALPVAAVLSLLGHLIGISNRDLEMSNLFRVLEEGLISDVRSLGSIRRVDLLKRSISASLLLVNLAILGYRVVPNIKTVLNDISID